MTMMDIRGVIVFVSGWRVDMPMRMLLFNGNPGRQMVMLVVEIIVLVAVIMPKALMCVRVRMVFRQQQPDPEEHQWQG